MNARQVLAAVALAASGSAALAVEAVQLDDTPSTVIREEVRQDLARDQADSFLMSGGEATVFVDRPVAAATRSRQEVRAEAYAALRGHALDALFVGG